MSKYILCTDGSAKLRTEGVYDSAYAFCLYDSNMNIIKTDSGLLKGKTNNYAEMYAIFKGTKYILEHCSLDGVDNIIIISDSNLCINSLTTWFPGWMKSSNDETLINSTGKPVINQEIIKSTFINTLILNTKTNVLYNHINSHQSKTKLLSNYNKYCFVNGKEILSFAEYEKVYQANDLCDRLAKKELGI